MVYRDQFVAVVKCGGKVLREVDGIVRLPFGSEYGIAMKNLSSRDALVKIQIDGQDVNEDGLIVKAGQDFPLERFIKGNMNEGNRFKFIQKTQKIIENRGDRLDDGMIRIEYWYEKPKPVRVDTHHHHHHHHHNDYWIPYRPYPPCRPWITWSTGTSAHLQNVTYTSSCNATLSSNSYHVGDVERGSVQTPEQIVSNAINVQMDEGITVPGSVSSQQFSYGTIGELEPNSSVIVIRLAGVTGQGAPVTQAITTKTKLKCMTCGTENKSSMKFCGECGTSLQIV